MRERLVKIRQELKRSLADLKLFTEENQEELTKLQVKDGLWRDSGMMRLSFADRSADNLIKNIDMILDTLPKKKKKNVGNRNKDLPLSNDNRGTKGNTDLAVELPKRGRKPKVRA